MNPLFTTQSITFRVRRRWFRILATHPVIPLQAQDRDRSDLDRLNLNIDNSELPGSWEPHSNCNGTCAGLVGPRVCQCSAVRQGAGTVGFLRGSGGWIGRVEMR